MGNCLKLTQKQDSSPEENLPKNDVVPETNVQSVNVETPNQIEQKNAPNVLVKSE